MAAQQIDGADFYSRFSADKRNIINYLTLLDICDKRDSETKVCPFKIFEIFVNGSKNREFFFSYKNNGGDIFIDMNSINLPFDVFCAEKIKEYRKSFPLRDIYLAFYGEEDVYEIMEENGVYINGDVHDECSYYCAPSAIVPRNNPEIQIRELTKEDSGLIKTFKGDEDDLLEDLFSDVFEEMYYSDGRILGAFAEGDFAGYAAHSDLAKLGRDINYIYVGKKYRRRGIAGALIAEYKNFCAENSLIAYYSYADGAESEELILKNGFSECAKRQTLSFTDEF